MQSVFIFYFFVKNEKVGFVLVQAERLEEEAGEARAQAEAVKVSSREAVEALRSQLAAAARELDVLRASSSATTDKALAALKVR